MSEQEDIPVKVGEMLAGKYLVERFIGIGGMGVVVAARHTELDELRAIKIMRGQLVGSAALVERFLREARAAVKLKSEHVAKVLDVGRLDSGAPFIVMEYLEGKDLSQHLKSEGPVSVERALGWMIHICDAVGEAHALGIIHRDLKSANLFLSPSQWLRMCESARLRHFEDGRRIGEHRRCDAND